MWPYALHIRSSVSFLSMCGSVFISLFTCSTCSLTYNISFAHFFLCYFIGRGCRFLPSYISVSLTSFDCFPAFFNVCFALISITCFNLKHLLPVTNQSSRCTHSRFLVSQCSPVVIVFPITPLLTTA